MKNKKMIICTLCLKLAFLLLTISIVLLPHFYWKTNTDLPDIKKAIKKNEYLENVNDKGATPLIGATTQGKTEMVKLLLDNGANINAHAQNPNDMIIE
ncbi:ankyrin repeat domain-containing protein, partial [bacterium]|nr:ankyrin repeat domain-containing protein [bacterium]